MSSGNIYYYAEDMLGSSRVIIQAGQTCPCGVHPERSRRNADFYPYGGERVVTNTCQQIYKFEGKERDAETGNDEFGARYYSSSFGCSLSPD
ncbi:MAG: RHS repeat-associated core domain-containing protein [Candidatus Acidiferrales bacterium]